jgi:tetratricopeptide (TPR) repeat protein
LLLQLQNATDSLSVRGRMMGAGLLIWQRHLLLGSGLGTMGQLALETWPPNTKIWPDAHNLALTLGAETGLAGVTGFLWLLVAAGWAGWRYFSTVSPSDWRLAGGTCLAALLGFLTHNQVDYLIKYPALMVYVAVLAGFWISQTVGAEPSQSSPKPWGRGLTTAVGLLLALTLFTGAQNLAHLRNYSQAVDAALRGDWATATAQLQTINRQSPGMPFYERQLGLTAGFLAQDELAYLPEAITSYQAAIGQVPWLPGDHANLACLLWQDDRPAAALEAIRQAHQRYPAHPVYHATLVHYLLETGNDAEAQTEAARLLSNHPRLIESAYWTETTARQQLLALALTTVAIDSRLTPIQLEYWVARDDSPVAQELGDSIRMQPDPDPFVLQLATGLSAQADGDLTRAEAAFVAAQEIKPAAGEPAYYLSKLYLAQGRLDDAAQSIGSAVARQPSSQFLFHAGQVAEAQGRPADAVAAYEAAFMQLSGDDTPALLTRYATEVARRRPLPATYLPCLVRLYPTDSLAAITLAQGQLLVEAPLNQPAEAARVYRRTLELDFRAESVATALNALCQEYREVCLD